MKKINLLQMFVASFLFLFIALQVSAYDVNRIPRPLPTGLTDPLPDGWAFKDVGNISPQTDWCYNAATGQYYLKAYGNNVWNSQDQFGFIYFKTDEDKQVVARIMDAEVIKNSHQKGFIMIRSSLADNASMVYEETKETANGGQVCFDFRLETGGGCDSRCIYTKDKETSTQKTTFPRWMKFIRQGLYVTSYHKDDVEGAPWEKIAAVVRLELSGKAYMGIGACGHMEDHPLEPVPAIMLFDNVTVTDIEVPYEVVGDENVDAFFAQPLRVGGKGKDVDVTSVFGHALGEYFTIDAESVDKSIADVYFWEKKATDEEYLLTGDEYRRFLHITGNRPGVTTIKMTCTIQGHTMTTDYSVCVAGGKIPHADNTYAPFGWELKNMEVPVEPVLEWGDEFVTKQLSISTKYPVFIGSWEYNWGGLGVGNYSKLVGNGEPTAIASSEIYVQGAERYTFRDELFRYTKAAGYAKDTLRGETGGFVGSGIDLAFLTKNSSADTVYYTGGSEKNSPSKGSDELVFVVSKDPSNKVIWDECKGFWTERINYTDRATGQPVRGLPYITNISPGDWVSYTVYAPRAGYYLISPVAACKEPNKSMEVQVNGIMQVPTLTITNGANGKDWKKGGTGKILLAKGKNLLKFISNSPTFNLLGFRVLFSTSSKEPYAGLSLNPTKYILPSEEIDMQLMNDEEKLMYDSILKVYPTASDADKLFMDSVKLTFPRIIAYDTDKVINRFKSELDSMQVPYGTKKEKLAALDTIKRSLTGTIDSLSFITTQQQVMKHIDVTSYLYKKGYDPSKPIEISLKIDSIGNAGRGTYMGVMLRTLLNDQVSPNSPAVSYGIGSFEGGRLTYRWGYNYEYKKLDLENIAHDVYIKLRLNYYAQDYLTAYYSYDNLFWWDFLLDPLKISFLSEGVVDDNIAIGLYLTGGTFAGDAILALGKARNFSIKQYDRVEEFDNIYSQEDMTNMKLSMSATTVSGNTPVTITYNVIKPGQVSLKVYDVYGILQETVMDEYKTFSKEAMTTTASFTGLKESGIYLLRLEGPDNEQYVRFRYNAE
ncbi:MAG: hypothetical protein PHI48_03700 [Bacteroidales bacterium]|nr:hypothetical protein [Bacteroidales bacterium]MDD4821645.1 hypothetical protein [Bacteroidales bacterium]